MWSNEMKSRYQLVNAFNVHMAKQGNMITLSRPCIMILWNVGILPQHYTASQHEDGGIVDLRNFGILPQHYTTSQREDGGIVDLRNVGILPQHFTASQHEEGGSTVLRNVGIQTPHYMAQQHRTTRIRDWICSEYDRRGFCVHVKNT
jgi:hypothetical protein